ncbi:MAG TPA: glycoside hydrolase family 127 protein [Candidatus Hydrogenedentes bacterium]|nr:glycoside hydrolase family 127 protein [Candidatus Hydrogenedentota bacterium]
MKNIVTAVCRMMVLAVVPALSAAGQAAEPEGQQMRNADYPITPVKFTSVKVQEGFWKNRMETNRRVTLEANFRKAEETGRIANFEKAAKRKQGKHQGIYFDDSDVYKIVEGAAYSLALDPDPALRERVDALVELFAAAQEPDGYLYTARTIDPDNPAPGSGKNRWDNIKDARELYCMGNMIEAAVAHYDATGSDAFLQVARKAADLIGSVFGPQARHEATGHPELELALVKLYRATGERRYLDLAKFFVDCRGNPEVRKQLFGPQYGDFIPVLQQDAPVGHAVRAAYFFAGVADVAACTGEKAYIEAIDRIWDRMVRARMYVTGGIGSRRDGEAFGEDYELPNKMAYAETCAAIANCLWSWRMFLLHGDSRYMDVFERALYNAVIPGVSMQGDTFFYPNPLESDGVFAFNHGSAERQPWFGCSCCPTNIVRFIPSVPGFAMAHADNRLYVNLYMSADAAVTLAGKTVRLNMRTEYPWEGRVQITVQPEAPVEFALNLRIPGWALDQPVPGDLYSYLPASHPPVTLKVNGKEHILMLEKGYASVSRKWNPGDTVELNLPMVPRRVIAHESVADNRGRVAFERGPLVYCFEGADNQGKVLNLFVKDDAPVKESREPDLLGGVISLSMPAGALFRDENGEVRQQEVTAKAIPYYAWCHRGANEMVVWMSRSAENAAAAPPPTLANRSKVTASFVCPTDSLRAVNDGAEPKRSADGSIPRMTWWDRKGTAEWIQYEFPEPARIEGCAVYWFDDRPKGGCRIPQAWRVLYRDGGEWKPAPKAKIDKPAANRWNEARFVPLSTDGLRIEVQLQDGFSGGILEWKLLEAK